MRLPQNACKKKYISYCILVGCNNQIPKDYIRFIRNFMFMLHKSCKKVKFD